MVVSLLFIPFLVMSANAGCRDDGNSIFVCKGFIGQQYFADATANNKFRIIRFINTEFSGCSKGGLNLAKFEQLKMVYFSDTDDCDCTCLGPNMKSNCPGKPNLCRIPQIQPNGTSSTNDQLSLTDIGPHKPVDEMVVKEQHFPTAATSSSEATLTSTTTLSTKSNWVTRSSEGHRTESRSRTTHSFADVTGKPSGCLIYKWSEWSDCVFNPNNCYEVGYQYRARQMIGQTCMEHSAVEKRDCKPRCEMPTKQPKITTTKTEPTTKIEPATKTEPRWIITPTTVTLTTPINSNDERTKMTTPRFETFTTSVAPPTTPINTNNKSEIQNTILAWISGAGGMVTLAGFVGIIVKQRCKVRRRRGGVEANATTECWLLKRLGIGRDQGNNDIALQRIERMLHRLEAGRLRDLERDAVGGFSNAQEENSDYGTIEIGSVGTSGHELLAEMDENE